MDCGVVIVTIKLGRRVWVWRVLPGRWMLFHKPVMSDFSDTEIEKVVLKKDKILPYTANLQGEI